jgi:hypothetical protein
VAEKPCGGEHALADNGLSSGSKQTRARWIVCTWHEPAQPGDRLDGQRGSALSGGSDVDLLADLSEPKAAPDSRILIEFL